MQNHTNNIAAMLFCKIKARKNCKGGLHEKKDSKSRFFGKLLLQYLL